MLVILDRQVAWLAGLAVFRGILILAVLTLPWLMAVSYQTDGAFLDIAIRGDFLSKVKSGQESHGAPIGTYFGLLGLLFWPGIAFVGFLVWQGRDMLRHSASRFCLAWLVGYWLAIEVVPTKLPHYVLPVLPALALLVAGALVVPVAACQPNSAWFYSCRLCSGGDLGSGAGGGIFLVGGHLWWAHRGLGVLMCGCDWLACQLCIMAVMELVSRSSP